ncbi:MAG TPA: SIR2 family protein [Stellaceae bacterium]
MTGAGFSRNWGVKLASEVWEDIFSDPAVQARPAVRAQLLRERSFERAFDLVMGPDFTPDDRTAFQNAIQNAFFRMDTGYQDAHMPLPFDESQVARFLRLFQHGETGTGYIFSLNQDLLLERRFHRRLGFEEPGIRSFQPNVFREGESHLVGEAGPRFFSLEKAPEFYGKLNYIKLHGSANWRNDDASRVMIIGAAKSSKIDASQILTWYRQIFEATLNAGDVRLMVIGYSFLDRHINTLIENAIANARLRLFVWDVQDVWSLFEKAPGRRQMHLMSGLMGAASRPFSDVFSNGPTDSRGGTEHQRIVQSFFAG